MKSIISRNDIIKRLETKHAREVNEFIECANTILTLTNDLPVRINTSEFGTLMIAVAERLLRDQGWRVEKEDDPVAKKTTAFIVS